MLMVYCHFIRISIHRPFISPDDSSKAPLPMLISTNAARGLCQIMHCLKEQGIVPIAYFEAMGFTAGLIILLNCWASVWHHRSVDWDKEMTYVDKAMGVLELAEERWSSGGRFWDLLNQLRWLPVDGTQLDIVYPSTTSGRYSDNY